jgi:hypothetical protein
MIVTERIEAWMDRIQKLPTNEQVYQFAYRNKCSVKYVKGQARRVYLQSVGEANSWAEGRVFEQDIKEFNYDIEQDVKGVDVDELYTESQKRFQSFVYASKMNY